MDYWGSMVLMFSVFAVGLLGISTARASLTLSARESITTLTTAQINSFTPYTYYAGAAYCAPAKTLAWNCGAFCNANPTFKPVASGGDGGSVQYWYVGYDPNLRTVIVSHEGTDRSKIQPLLTDLDFSLTKPDPGLFPKLDSSIQVHDGFKTEQASTAKDVLAAVQKTMSQYHMTSVTIVGHSLGGALALLDSVYLPLWLPAGTTFQTFTYGLPRVGNKAFADYVDAHLNLTHINNKKDFVPILPLTSQGFVHPSGEVHIKDSGAWVACPGQDNPSADCIVGSVPGILDGNLDDHFGPYNNGTMLGSC